MSGMRDAFAADAKSTFQLLAEPGQGLYIPAYQRPYAWARGNIRRLFGDVGHGISLLANGHTDAITFIGTIILIQDTKYETVEPHIQGQMPGKVMLIIDGQQRLATLLMLNAVLHNEISRRAIGIARETASEYIWLHRQTLPIKGRLEKTIFEDMSYGDPGYQNYPRMIRAFQDSWSRFAVDAKYRSPVSLFLKQFIDHVSGGSPQRFRYEVPDDAEERGGYDHIQQNQRLIERLAKQVAEEDGDEEEGTAEFPTRAAMASSREFQEALFNAAWPDEVIERFVTDSEDDEKFQELLRLVVFAHYLLDRVAMVVVSAKSEDYAFDMFEALNTTGEPLTAFDTFKPRIIKAEGLSDYKTTPSFEHVTAIETYLERYPKADEKHTATSRLLVPFALAESGKKLSKRLNDQRLYLKMEYERSGPPPGSIEERRRFSEHLAHTAQFIKHAWPDRSSERPSIPSLQVPEEDTVLMCIDVLRNVKHAITLAPLVRFFSRALLADPTREPDAAQDFAVVVKAIVAFYALWRGSRRTTENIDSVYRKLMRGDEGCRGFARNVEDGRPTISAVDFKREMKRELTDLLGGQNDAEFRENWVRLAKVQPTYDVSESLAKFLLFSATHDTAVDPDNPGLVRAGRVGTLPMLTLDRWNSSEMTVEHVAPQTRSDVWDASLYLDPDLVHRLGNLTLLPQAENSSAGARPWKHKRLFYGVLAATTIDEMTQGLAAARAEGIEFSESTETMLQRAKYLPHLLSLGKVEAWDVAMVEKRSERVAELAWDRLWPWLG